jgi:hypothetical protein
MTVWDMQMPPGSANPSNRAAMFTPLAIEVSAFDDHVADIDPDAKLDAFALRSRMPRWTSIAALTASTTLGNSMRMPSPLVFTTRVGYCLFLGSTVPVGSEGG